LPWRGIVIATFIFVPWVPSPAVITAAQRLDYGQAFADKPFFNEMRRYLVFNAGPYLVGIDKGQCRLVAPRPTAQE
jgi:hypothetical protein